MPSVNRSNQRPIKDPDAVLDYDTNWSSWLLEGETITTSTWLLSGGDSDADPAVATTLHIDSDSKTEAVATVWLSKGTLDSVYTLVNRIVTNQGRTEDRSKFITIRQK